MKRVSMSFAASLEHKPAHPERTARKSVGWDVVFQTWTNRAAMARSIRMQERGAPSATWKPVVPLADGEGF